MPTDGLQYTDGHPGPRSMGVIVYLTQVRHSSYGRDSLFLLRRSVRLLFAHYNRRARDDVLFLHTGVPLLEQHRVTSLCAGSHAHWMELPHEHFVLPAKINQKTWRLARRYSAGCAAAAPLSSSATPRRELTQGSLPSRRSLNVPLLCHWSLAAGLGPGLHLGDAAG